jgi:hypothetical protein
VKAAIRPHDSVRHSSPPRCGKLWKTSVVDPQSPAGLRAGRFGDFTTLGPVCSHSNGGRAGKTSERAQTFQPTSVSISPFVRRRRACEALNYVGWSALRH